MIERASLILLVYCLFLVAASLAGGLVALNRRLTHRGMQVAVSFISGVALGIAMLHLLPHALETLSPTAACGWLLGGLLFMFVLERFFCFHHHDPSHDDEADDGSHTLSWMGVAPGLTIHSILAGVALGAAMEISPDSPGIWPGLAVFTAILLHKPLDSLTLGVLMASGKWSRSSRHLVNILFALAVPAGAMLFWWGAGSAALEHSPVIAIVLAFSAGIFLCVALSDLLPELQFHDHDRLLLTCALLAGLALAWSISRFETSPGMEEGASPSTADVATYSSSD